MSSRSRCFSLESREGGQTYPRSKAERRSPKSTTGLHRMGGLDQAWELRGSWSCDEATGSPLCDWKHTIGTEGGTESLQLW